MVSAFNTVWLEVLVGLLLLLASARTQTSNQPHIVFIMADDLGWNDVSYHGSDQIQTPNIDALAYQGVILQQYYTEPVCTPARSALLTGKYPYRLGMQGLPLYNSEDRGIPVSERLLPSYLKELGYTTHLVGKWHVGMSRNEYLPLRRGYDTHFGMRGGFVDYYTYNKVEQWPNGRVMVGMDLFEGSEQLDDQQEYLTDMLTDRAVQVIRSHNASRPLFLQLTHGAPHAGNAGALLQPPPPAPSLRNQHIAHSDRRNYANVVTSLDRSVGRVMTALADSGLLGNSIVVFVSDNGAPTVDTNTNWGVNLPFRGIKQTPWEGSMRVPALLWHANLRPNVWNGLMHITDWLPTLVSAAGGDVKIPIDGFNLWNAINLDGRSPRTEFVSLDDINNFASIRSGDLKLIVGNGSALRNEYYGEQLMEMKALPPPYMVNVGASETARALARVGRRLRPELAMQIRAATAVRQLDPVRDTTLCAPTLARGCLFDVVRDPMEAHDLWDASGAAARLVARLRDVWRTRSPRGPPRLQSAADPATRRYTWLPWLPDSAPSPTSPQTTSFPMDSSSGEISGSGPDLKQNLTELRFPDPGRFTPFLCSGFGRKSFLCFLSSFF